MNLKSKSEKKFKGLVSLADRRDDEMVWAGAFGGEPLGDPIMLPKLREKGAAA
jgi:hypothetical protein